jgi:hypothetical protein
MRTVILFLFIPILTFSQAPLVKQWDKSFGGNNTDNLTSFQQTNDGGYVMGGWSWSGISGNKSESNWDTTLKTYDYWIVKTDSIGNKEWDKRFGGTDKDAFYCLQQTQDGGFILGGFSFSKMSGDKMQNSLDTSTNPNSVSQRGDFWVVKISANGNKEWDKSFGGNRYDLLYTLRQTKDGGYIFGGESNSDISADKSQSPWGSNKQSDYWVIKTDALGNKEWDKRFGGINYDALHTLVETTDGGYILGGISGSDSSGNKTEKTRGGIDYWIVKIDGAGNKQWDKRFGGTRNDLLYSLQQTTDGGYILGGYSGSGIGGDKTQALWDTFIPGLDMEDYWILKIDSQGNKEWDKGFGGFKTDVCQTIQQTSDGGFLASGSSFSPANGDKSENNLGQRQTWVVKTDAMGIKEWDKTILTDGVDAFGSAIQAKDGCYVIADYTSSGVGGYKTQQSWGSYDFWIIKFCDASYMVNSLNASITDGSKVVVFPNPFSNQLTFSVSVNEQTTVSLYNFLGQEILQQTFTNSTTINTEQLADGIYFYELRNDTGTLKTGKVIKQ